MRAVLARLYRAFLTPCDRQDIHTLVRELKELYEGIEQAIDGCEDVSNTLTRLALKGG